MDRYCLGFSRAGLRGSGTGRVLSPVGPAWVLFPELSQGGSANSRGHPCKGLYEEMSPLRPAGSRPLREWPYGGSWLDLIPNHLLPSGWCLAESRSGMEDRPQPACRVPGAVRVGP